MEALSGGIETAFDSIYGSSVWCFVCVIPAYLTLAFTFHADDEASSTWRLATAGVTAKRSMARGERRTQHTPANLFGGKHIQPIANQKKSNEVIKLIQCQHATECIQHHRATMSPRRVHLILIGGWRQEWRHMTVMAVAAVK